MNKCALNEKARYEAKGYKAVIVSANDVTDVAGMIARGMYEDNLKAFTYFGHGDAGDSELPPEQRTKGALYVRHNPQVAMTSGDLATSIYEYMASKQPEDVCPAQLDYMRLFSCWSGRAQWNSNADLLGLPSQHTFRQAFLINPSSRPWIKTKGKRQTTPTWTACLASVHTVSIVECVEGM